MPVSKVRWLVRGALILGVVALLGLLARDRRVKDPEYLLRRAQAEQTAGNRAAAILDVMNVLVRFPDRADAHFFLAELELDDAREQAKAQNVPADKTPRLSRVPKALAHFRRAAELRPDDPSLQKTLMEAELEAGSIDRATTAAERLGRLRPDVADAQYLLLW